MKVDCYTSNTVFAELQAEWNALLERSVSNTPFSTWEWHKHWWDAYHPGDLWLITVRDDLGRLLGIASLFIKTSANERSLHFVGCEDVTDYLDFIVDKQHQDVVYRMIAETLLANRHAFDTLDLCNIPQESPTFQNFPALLEAKGFTVATKPYEVCPIITLPETFDAYLDALDKKQGKELRRKLRVAEGQGDSVSWYTVNETHDLHAEVEKFMKLMAASHPEKAQFLLDDQHVAFFQSIVPAAMAAGWLQLNFLNVAGESVAAYLNFDYQNQIMVYNSGLEPNKAAALSPGIILLAYNIRDAIEKKRSVFDFLRGDEQYKYRMGGQDSPIYKLEAQYAQ